MGSDNHKAGRPAGHDVIVIGASAGGVEAVARLVAGLPLDLPAAVFVVLHFPSHSKSVLPTILNRAGSLPAAHPEDGEPIRAGRIYVAPPDSHLLLRDGHVGLTRGPRENGTRPAIDPLFRSAARSYGPRVVGVVLTGALDDGTAGLIRVKQRGGIAVVQDPDEALFPGMPQSALEAVPVDHVAGIAEMPALLARLAREPVEEAEMPEDYEASADPAEGHASGLKSQDMPGAPSALTCPECGGAVWEDDDGSIVRFQCHVGHAYSAESMIAEQASALEGALWTALRALEESAELARRMCRRAKARGHSLTATRFAEHAHDVERKANLVRRVLLGGETLDADLAAGAPVLAGGAAE